MPTWAAVSLGAVIVERHITLDRASYGSDQAASLEQKGLRDLVDVLRKIPTIIGKEEKHILDIEKEVAQKLRYWEK